MNLREINRMIASLIAEGKDENKELIEFYRRKREELIVKIKEDVAKKLEGDVMQLTAEQIRKMKHALGISHDHKNNEVVPNKIYRPKLKSYRNHYQIDQCGDWDDLVEKGFAKKKEAFLLNFYLVTTEGIAYLQELGYRFEREN